MTVSLTTVTCWKRAPFFRLLVKTAISKQTYPIHQWVIVFHLREIFPDEREAALKYYQEELQTLKLPNISEIQVFLVDDSTIKIGALRNISNSKVTGDFIINFDDDDVYPTTHVEHYVEQLQKHYPEKLIAGCPNHFMYEYTTDQYWQFTSRSTTQCINANMGYHRDYLKDHRYDESVPATEEQSFLNNYQTQIIRIHPYQAGIQLSHAGNTVNKRGHTMMSNIIIRATESVSPEIYISPEYLEVMRQTAAIYTEKLATYDIVYYCGMQGNYVWSPKQRDLGGSEKAVVELARQWAQMGKKVAVFASVQIQTSPFETIDGVDYYLFENFHYRDCTIKHLIVWRLSGLHPLLAAFWNQTLQAKYVYIDLHDQHLNPAEFPDTFRERYPKAILMCKSNFHRQILQQQTRISNVCRVIQNGVQYEVFQQADKKVRHPYRMVYTSCYSRGLSDILQHIWPTILQLEPRAELHLYYGMDLLSAAQPQHAEEIRQLILKTRNICDHGRAPIEIVAYDKCQCATVHLYTTNTLSETDCIAIKESTVAGLIPCILNTHVFQERVGVRFPFSEVNAQTGPQIAQLLIQALRDYQADPINSLLGKFLTENANNPTELQKTIPNWTTVAQTWAQMFQEVEDEGKPSSGAEEKKE